MRIFIALTAILLASVAQEQQVQDDDYGNLDANAPIYDYETEPGTAGDVGITGDAPVVGDTEIGEQLVVDPIAMINGAVQAAQSAQQAMDTAAGQMQNLALMGVIASDTGMSRIESLMSQAQSLAGHFTPEAHHQLEVIHGQIKTAAAQVNADLTAQDTAEPQKATIALQRFLENLNVAVNSNQQVTTDIHTIAQNYAKQLSDFKLNIWKQVLAKGQEFLSKGQKALNTPATTPEMKELAQNLTLDGQKMISTVQSAMEQWPKQVNPLSNELEQQIQQQLSSGKSTGAQLQKDISDIGQDWAWNTMAVDESSAELLMEFDMNGRDLMERMYIEAANAANEAAGLLPEDFYDYMY